MAEVFSRAATRLKGAFSAEHGRLSFGSGVPVALTQNINAQYQQAVARLYELGNEDKSANVYYVGGRTAGNLTIGRVLGPGVLMGSFYQKFGDVCQAAGNLIQLIFDPLACTGGRAVWTLKYCILVNIGISIADTQSMIVNENSQLMFSGMEYEDGGVAGSTGGEGTSGGVTGIDPGFTPIQGVLG